jgi:hypothetical protein
MSTSGAAPRVLTQLVACQQFRIRNRIIQNFRSRRRNALRRPAISGADPGSGSGYGLWLNLIVARIRNRPKHVRRQASVFHLVTMSNFRLILKKFYNLFSMAFSLVSRSCQWKCQDHCNILFQPFSRWWLTHLFVTFSLLLLHDSLHKNISIWGKF